MFTTLILCILIFGGAGYFIKGKYEEMLKIVDTVHKNKKQLQKQVSDRHKVTAMIMKAADDHSLFNEDIDVLPGLKQRIQEATELGEEAKLIKAEEELTMTLDSLDSYLAKQESEDMKKIYSNMTAINGKYKQFRDKYNQSIEAYEDMGEDFINSIMIAVFEKQLCFKFTYWELPEDDENGDDDDSGF